MGALMTLLCAAFAVLLIFEAVRAKKARDRLRNESETVAVGRNTKPTKVWLALSAVWVVLSVINIIDCTSEIGKIESGYYDSAYRINTDSTAETSELREKLSAKPRSKRYLYILMTVTWSITGAVSAAELKKGKYSYIAESGVYFPGRFLPAENFSYAVKKGTLYLYRKKYKKPIEYTVIGEKERLTKMLEAAYTPYHEKYD